MTENEAMEWLAEETSPMKIHIAAMNGENPMEYINEAVKVACHAFEEIKQYRAMEEKLNGISVKEVVDGFISAVEKETCEGYERGRILTNEDAEKWNAYRGIGTVEEVKELKEKATPKKPILSKSMMTKKEYQICPICERLALYDGIKFDYCQYCGQKLDWEGR